MKVSELFSRALALLNEEEGRARVYKKNCLPLVNQLLAQCLSTENAIREAKGQALLTTVGKVESMTDVIPYDENFVSACMPYGLAALFSADDDRSMANAMGAQFEELKAGYQAANFQNIRNYYV